MERCRANCFTFRRKLKARSIEGLCATTRAGLPSKAWPGCGPLASSRHYVSYFFTPPATDTPNTFTPSKVPPPSGPSVFSAAGRICKCVKAISFAPRTESTLSLGNFSSALARRLGPPLIVGFPAGPPVCRCDQWEHRMFTGGPRVGSKAIGALLQNRKQVGPPINPRLPVPFNSAAGLRVRPFDTSRVMFEGRAITLPLGRQPGYGRPRGSNRPPTGFPAPSGTPIFRSFPGRASADPCRPNLDPWPKKKKKKGQLVPCQKKQNGCSP